MNFNDLNTILLTVALTTALFSSLIGLAPLAHATSSTTESFALDLSQTFTTCLQGTSNGMVQNPTSPLTATTSSAGYGYGFCNESPFSSTSTLSITSVNITLYLESTTGGPATAGVVSGNMQDTSNSNNQIYSFSNQPFVASPTGCTKNNITVTGLFSPLIPGHNLIANFEFYAASGGPTIIPTFCTGGSTLNGESHITIEAVPTVPTPEFPFGTVLSVLAPLAAIAAYVFLTTRFRQSRPAVASF